MEKIYELNKYVNFQLYTVDKFYVLQLFDPNDNPNDVDVSCIWENDHFDLNYLFDEAIEWCKERIEKLDR